jgi:exopolysaccharide production protein ExoZ
MQRAMTAGRANDKGQIIRPLGGIQILRAIAALSVVTLHMQGELAHRGFDDPFPSLATGAFGVDLFFVISGFIMVYSSGRLFAQPHAGRRFFIKRIIRIVPLYWVFTSISVAIAVILAQFPGHPAYSVKHILSSYLFIPMPRPGDGAMLPTCPIGWTLNFEMFFYVCFAASLRWNRPITVAIVGSSLATLAIVGFLTQLPETLAFWASSLTLEFCLGMLLALIYLAGWYMNGWVRLALVATGLFSAMLYVPYVDSWSNIRGIAWGVPAAAIVGAAILTKAAATGPIARLLGALGDASYSLYLAHTALFIFIYVAISRIADPHRIPSMVYGFGLVIASVLSAFAAYAWMELPMMRFLNRALYSTDDGILRKFVRCGRPPQIRPL